MGMLINNIENDLSITISWSHIDILPKSKLIAVLISTCVPMIIKEFTPHHISMVLMRGIFENKMDKQIIDVIPHKAAPIRTRMLSGRMLFNSNSLQLLCYANNTVNVTDIIATIDSNKVFEHFTRVLQYALLT